MCRRVTCDRCGKPAFAGCGAHVEQVLAGVPKADRCHCRETRPSVPAPGAKPLRGPGAWLRGLLGQK